MLNWGVDTTETCNNFNATLGKAYQWAFTNASEFVLKKL